MWLHFDEERGGFGGSFFERVVRNFATLFVRASTWMNSAVCGTGHRTLLTTMNDSVMTTTVVEAASVASSFGSLHRGAGPVSVLGALTW